MSDVSNVRLENIQNTRKISLLLTSVLNVLLESIRMSQGLGRVFHVTLEHSTTPLEERVATPADLVVTVIKQMLSMEVSNHASRVLITIK